MLAVPKGTLLPFRILGRDALVVPDSLQICLLTYEEIDLSASVTTKLVFASVKIMLSMTAILNINQVSITDMSGK